MGDIEKTSTHSGGSTRVAAYGLLLRNDALLLCRLSSHVVMHAGHWTLPGGGLEFGEHPETALRREFLEETGLTIAVEQLLGVDSICDALPGQQPVHSIRLLYSVKCQTLANEKTQDQYLVFEENGTTDMCAWHSKHSAGQLRLVDLAKYGLDLALGNTSQLEPKLPNG